MRGVVFICALLLPEITLAQSPHPKKVTIELDNISLEKALTVLSISYGVEFSYSDDVVPTQQLVNISIQNEELPAALDRLLKPFNLDYKVTSKRILIKRSATVLTQSVRGSVREPVTNAPLPGITIIVKNN